MMHFSDRLMNAEVEIAHGAEPSRGYVVTLYEGRNWTPMAGVRFFSGPEKGHFIPVPLEALKFVDEDS